MDYGDSGSTAAEAAKIAENAEVGKTYTISADRSSCPIRSLILDSQSIPDAMWKRNGQSWANSRLDCA